MGAPDIAPDVVRIPLTGLIRFEEAFTFTLRLHLKQRRKSTNIPYIAHLMSVAALVMENGGDEEQAIAALLHDAVEDQGGIPTLQEIRRRFGDRVAVIVQGCTDADTHPKPPWRARKEQYIAHVLETTPDVRLVSLADKIHNARALLSDYRQVQEQLWERFNPNAGRDGTLWYYRALVEAFRTAGDHLPMVEELDRVLTELESLVRSATNGN